MIYAHNYNKSEELLKECMHARAVKC